MDESGSKWNVNYLKERNIAVEPVSVDRQVQWRKDTATKLFATAFKEKLRFDAYSKRSLGVLARDALSLIDFAESIMGSNNEEFVRDFVQCVLVNTFHPYQGFTRLVPEARCQLGLSSRPQPRPDFSIVVGYTPVLIVQCKKSGEEGKLADVEAQLASKAVAAFHVYQEGAGKLAPGKLVENLALLGWIQIGPKGWFYQFDISQAQHKELKEEKPCTKPLTIWRYSDAGLDWDSSEDRKTMLSILSAMKRRIREAEDQISSSKRDKLLLKRPRASTAQDHDAKRARKTEEEKDSK